MEEMRNSATKEEIILWKLLKQKNRFNSKIRH